MGTIPKNLNETIIQIAETLSGSQYAIRGTASLFLQGIDMNVDDIDIICDKSTALLCSDLFAANCKQQVAYRESDKFRSWFGKFETNGIPIEVMGEWEIKLKSKKLKVCAIGASASGGKNEKLEIEEWGEVYNARPEHITTVELQSTKVNVTTVETELRMFAQMGRWNAYWKIKKQMNTDRNKMKTDKEQIKTDDNEQPKLL